MYKLYYLSGTCSMAVHVILNELGQEVTLEDVSVPAGQPRSPEFLKINPRGNVPVLADGDIIIREGGAIISYLLDKHNSPMLPKSGKERANALEWLMFANATMHPSYARAFFVLRNITDETVKAQAFKAALEQINKNWADIDAQLAKTKYLCGENISAADILITVIANWGITTFPERAKIGDNVKRLIKEIIARPSYQKAIATEKVDYKAAA